MPNISVWGPVLAVVSELQSSDGMLRMLNLAGFAAYNLSKNDNYSHSTRKRAYNRLASEEFSKLPEDQQW